MQTIITIDPGVNGAAVAWSSLNPSEIRVQKLSDGDEGLILFLSRYSEEDYPGEVKCFLEKVGGYIPKGEDGEGQPGSRMFVFGNSYGFIRGVLATLQIKTIFVLPQQWQRGIPGRNGSYSQRKTALRKHAQKLFPTLTVTNADADALSMLHYARSAIKLSQTKAPPIVAKPPVQQFKTMDEAFTEIKRASQSRPQTEARNVLDLPLKKQMALAVAWCERNNYTIPEPGTPERAEMFNYWQNLTINNEA